MGSSLSQIADRLRSKKNINAFEHLKTTLKQSHHDIRDIPFLFQWNKQDVDDILTPEEWDNLLNERGDSSIAASAERGENVLETLEQILEEIAENVEMHLKASSKRLPKKKLGLSFKKKKEEETEEELEDRKIPKKKLGLGLKKLKISKPAETASKEDHEEKDEQVAKKKLGLGLKKLKMHKEEEPKPSFNKEASEIRKNEETKEETKQTEQEAPPEETKRSEEAKPKETKQPEETKQTEEVQPEEAKAEETKQAKIKLNLGKQEAEEKIPETKRAPSLKKTKPAGNFLKKLANNNADKKVKKPLKKSRPKKTLEEALAILEEGDTLENSHLDVLDLRNQSFEKSIRIIKCQFKSILMEGADFKGSITIENSNVSDSIIAHGEIPTLFRDNFQLKNVEILGNCNLDQGIFSKNLTIIDCNFSKMLKIQDISCEKNFTLQNNKMEGIAAQDSRFRGNTSICGCIFSNVVGFQNSCFSSSVLVSSSEFQRAHFMDTYFQGKMEFARCIFETSGNFGKIQAEKNFSFEGCVFNGNFNIAGGYLKGEAYIRRTEFCGDASFAQMLSSGSLCFEKVTFTSIADFSAANFARVEFLQSVFHGQVNFQESIFSENASLKECEFNQRTHFVRAIFLQKLDFRGTEWKNSVTFANMIGDYIILEREQIENKLLSEKNKDYTASEQEYLTLKYIFAKQGLYKDCSWAHYHYKRAARKSMTVSANPIRAIYKFCSWLFGDIGSGYGTKPANVLILAFIFAAIFAGIYGGLFASDLQLPSSPEWKKWVAAARYSFATLMPAGVEHWKELMNTPIDKEALQKAIPMMVACLENLIGLFLMFLFFFSSIKKILQD